jgi:multidrug resistance efflux pump
MTANGEIATNPGSSPPASMRRIALFGAVALLSSAAIVFWIGNVHQESHTGYLHSVNESITAGRQARITQLLVKPGQIVAPGTALLVLRDVSLEASRLHQQNAIAALEAELRQAQARASVEIADRKAKLEASVFETQLKLASFEEKRFDQRLALFASESRVMIAEAEDRLDQPQVASNGEMPLPFETLTLADVRHQPKPKKQDFLFELQQRETTRNKVETSETQVILCETQLAMLKKQLESADAQINEAFGVNVIQTRIAAAQAALVQIDAETPTLTLTATKHGTVGVFAKSLGEMVASQEVIVELFDAEQPYIFAEIPTSRLTQFPANQEVELVFPGEISRRGTVSELPPQAAPLPGPRERLADNCGQLRLQILPSGQLWPKVPFGTRVEVRSLRSTPRPIGTKTEFKTGE